MGFTATDGETEGLAWSHRGSTHAVPRLCPLPACTPDSLPSSALLRTLFESAPLLFRGLQRSGGGEEASATTQKTGRVQLQSALTWSFRVPSTILSHHPTPWPPPQKAKDAISTIVPKRESAVVPLKAYRTGTCCYPRLAPSSPCFNHSTTLNAAGRVQGETISGLS